MNTGNLGLEGVHMITDAIHLWVQIVDLLWDPVHSLNCLHNAIRHHQKLKGRSGYRKRDQQSKRGCRKNRQANPMGKPESQHIRNNKKSENSKQKQAIENRQQLHRQVLLETKVDQAFAKIL